jgi:hypothetical protein
MPDWLPHVVEQGWSFVAVALLVYQIGVASKAIATRFGWRGPGSWYDLTLRLHPLAGGALFGLIPLPTLDAIDSIEGTAARIAARCGWFLLAGAVCGQVYESVKFGSRWLQVRAGIRATMSPSQPPDGEA